MDITQIKSALVESVNETVPAIVEASVKAETASLSQKIVDVETQMKEIATQAKFGGENATKELHSVTAKYFKSMVRKSADFAEAKTKFLNIGTDADGGYLVPVEFGREVIRVAKEVGFARKYCRIIPMATDTKTVNKIINGVTVQWTAEGVAITPSDAAFGQVELIARKLTALVSATNELIDDNMSDTEVFTLITTLIGEAMAEFEDAQVLVGSGTGSNFAGIFTAGTAIQTSAITEAAPTFVEIVALKNKIPMKYRKANSRSLAFVMNQEMYSKVESMVDLEGRPLLKESFKRDQDEVTLLGYPVEVVDSAPVDKIAFGNFYFYLLGERRAMTLEQGYATGDFESDIKSLKASKRIAGAIVYKDAFVVSI